MKELFNYLESFNVISITLRIILATIFGGLVGIERGIKRRPAGLRTFALVCSGSTLAMLINEYLCTKYGITGDPSRMAAQVISGIGFLGAGMIIINNNQRIKGLTTAASLWATAIMGLAIGSAFYLGALLGLISIFISITILHKLDNTLYGDKTIELYIEIEKIIILNKLISYIRNNDYNIISLEIKKEKSNSIDQIKKHIIIIELGFKKKNYGYDIISSLLEIDGVDYVEEIKQN